MRISIYIFSFLLLPAYSIARQNSPVHTIAREPATMMDIGLSRLNVALARAQYPGLKGATMNAKYNRKRGTIDIKVSMPVKKATKDECKALVNNAKNIFVKTYNNKKTSNIHYYFQHEGTDYRNRINWNQLSEFIVITGIVLTKKNYQHSVYCQGYLMKNKVTY